ncbi:MAG: Ig-like domain-containing protein [Myxococcota bacterium]
MMVPIADETVVVGQRFEASLFATDPDGDFLVFSLAEGPDDAEVQGSTFRWTPDENDVGTHEVTVSVLDDGDPPRQGTTSFVITVPPPPNGDPVAQLPVLPCVFAEEPLELTLEATDPDGDNLTWSSKNPLPLGAVLTPEGQFSWTPPPKGVGVRLDLEFVVTDDGEPPASDSLAVSFDVIGPDTLCITAQARFAESGDLIPEGICVDLIDPTPLVTGDDPLLINSTVVGPEGTLAVGGTSSLPVLGLHVRLHDGCSTAPSGVLGVPSNTLLIPAVYAGDLRPPQVDVTGISVEFFDDLNASAAALGDPSDLDNDAFVFGTVVSNERPPMPLPNVDVLCAGCPDDTVYYLDADPNDRFGSGMSPNPRTGTLGMFVIPNAVASQYLADQRTADPLDLDPVLVAPIQREATIIQFIGR